VRFELQPVLKGARVQLRPLNAADYEALREVASDPLIWEQHPDQTRHQPEGFRVFFERAMASGGALLAIDAATQRVIGSSRFHGYDEAASEVEIGWTFLARTHWGGAYNREMKHLMLQHAFRFVRRVVLLVGSRNFRSQRAVEKIGGVRAGSRRDAEGREDLRFEITATAFAEQVSASGNDGHV
jgi:RimJ/RimL family protein N-acetyltransferase